MITSGVIPVLVLLPNPTNDQVVVSINTQIENIARTRNVPLLNLVAIGLNNPTLVDANGVLTQSVDPAVTAGTLTDAALQQYGLNNAVLYTLQTLNAIKTNVIDVTP